MFCKNCGKEIDEDARFCPECGTALIAAAQVNALKAGKLLIAHGASVDIRDSYGLTPLTAAVSINALDFAKLLLDNGAKVNRFSTETSPLLLAACLLIERGANIYVQDKRGYTPVLLLARKGLSLVLRKLMDAKCLSQLDMEIALMYATIGGHLSLIKYLIYEKMDVNFQTPEGFSLLTLAAMGNYKDIVQFLLEQGADLELRDKMGLRPLDHAERDGRVEIQKMLTEQYKKKNIIPQPAYGQDYQGMLNLFLERHLAQHPGKKAQIFGRAPTAFPSSFFPTSPKRKATKQRRTSW